ncbi:GAP1-N2 domain-containing protein [Mycolicibacterium llatzerense]|uniref:GAP1-N2 domain-containing protein n=1 Tax=Mycolicibacterium llatzerense TaxID=280871 RepID=UPI0021B58D68|nr:hypothetical protein [Mycolicibacterium llatzerense]MCT7366647.1 hypothetical protein [Mycolicibacterium llatzerense]
MNDRYGQLTYTSFDTARAAGGWQIKQTSGDLTPDETKALLAGVRTAFRPVTPLPDYPTPEQLAAGPRRLAYVYTPTAAHYWHSVPAGTDSTGRPGNVLAHALIDRLAAHPGDRPIERWRSPQWLCPFGAAAVARATLPTTAPTPAGAVSRDSVVAFLFDPTIWRMGTLFGLLDAVAAAMSGGPPVVLGTTSPDAAAQWIGLISYLMSPATAATLNFSTFDRVEAIGQALHAGYHVTAVPVCDLDAVDHHTLVVIDETATVSLGELGGEPHRTSGGQAIAVTAWSSMAQVVLIEPTMAARVFAAIDHHAAKAGDARLHPAWPMAMAVATDPTFDDAIAEAHTVIAAHSPPHLDGEAAVLVGRAVTDLAGTTTGDAWRALEYISADGPAAEAAREIYLCRAIADPDWLNQSRQLPARAGDHRRPIPPTLSSAIGPALDEARAAGPGQLLRVVDLLIRSGINDGRLLAAAETMAPALLAPHEGAAVAACLRDTIGASTRLRVGAAVLRAAHPNTVDDAVLAWLAAGITAPTRDGLPGAQPWDHTWCRAALRGVVTLRRGPHTPDDRLSALWWLRVSGSEDFARAVGAAVWDPADLLAVVGPADLPAAAVLPTLLGAPDSRALTDLCLAVAASATDPVADACAALRAVDVRTWAHDGAVAGHQPAYNDLWDQAVGTVGAERVHRDFAARLLTVSVAAALDSRPYPQVCADWPLDSTLAGDVVTAAVGLIAGSTQTTRLATAVCALRDDDPAGTQDTVGELLTQVVHQIVGGSTHSDEELTAVAALMGELSGDTSERTARRYRKALTKWFAGIPQMQPGGPAVFQGEY